MYLSVSEGAIRQGVTHTPYISGGNTHHLAGGHSYPLYFRGDTHPLAHYIRPYRRGVTYTPYISGGNTHHLAGCRSYPLYFRGEHAPSGRGLLIPPIFQGAYTHTPAHFWRGDIYIYIYIYI